MELKKSGRFSASKQPQKMIRKILKNGLTVMLEKRKTNSVVIEVTARVGSIYEPENLQGISHFIEHLIFSGTKKRSSMEIAREIESLGGEFNAFTWQERTSFYVKISSKHIDNALDVLSDCVKNPQFKDEEVEKERNIILSEIDIRKDTPTVYQWDLFLNKLFKKNKAKNPVIGTKDTVRAIKKRDILDFYNKHYNSMNLIITVTGNFSKDLLKRIEYSFKDARVGEKIKELVIEEPAQKFREEYIENKKIDHSYLMIGYKVPTRKSEDSYTLDVIRTILGAGMSSRLFNEIRTKRGLGYSVGAHYDANRDFAFFVSSVTTEKNNVEKCKNILIDEYQKIKDVSDKELKDAKNFMEGQYLLENEDNFRWADLLSYFEIMGDARHADFYIKKIKMVTRKDIKKVASKYFTENYCCTLITG
ncbi:MAG: pitrilysin family protein [Nanoarchaeota archaeon]